MKVPSISCIVGAGLKEEDLMRNLRHALIGQAMVLSLLVVHCGGAETSGGDNGTRDAGAQDSRAVKDASHDISTPRDAGRDSGKEREDAKAGDATDLDSADTGSDSADAGMPCLVDAGDAGSGCVGELTCCGGSCVDTTKDPNNCGACAHACSATQFCAAPACDDAILSNLCVNPKATIVQDTASIDNAAGNEIAGALTGCVPPVTFTTVAQTDKSAFDQTTHRPLLGPGSTLIAGGGGDGQLSVAYLDSAGVSPAYIVEDATVIEIVDRMTGASVVADTAANLTAHHDYFLLVLAVDPISGTLCFSGEGTGGPGTNAAGYYFANDVMPNLATYSSSWYAYEWADVDMNSLPSAGDTFTLKGSGN
jgi:hypothetical protein